MERESRRREKDEFETTLMNMKSEKEMLMHNVDELRKQLELRELQIQKQTSKLNQMEAFKQELKQKEQELKRETMMHQHEKETQRSRDRHNIDLGDLIRLDSDKDSHDEDVSDDSEPDAFVDLSEMSESTIGEDDIDSTSSERWSSRVDNEEAALRNAVSYCEHQRRSVIPIFLITFPSALAIRLVQLIKICMQDGEQAAQTDSERATRVAS